MTVSPGSSAPLAGVQLSVTMVAPAEARTACGVRAAGLEGLERHDDACPRISVNTGRFDVESGWW